MGSLDIKNSYEKVQSKIESTKAYKDLKTQYYEAINKKGDSKEEKKSKQSSRLDSVSGKTKSYLKNTKSQFDHLLDVNNTLGSNSLKYLKKKFIQTLKVIEPKIVEILFDEIKKAIGCDQQPSYTPEVPVYIKLSSIDLSGLLTLDPDSDAGKLLYEKISVTYQSSPFAMNKELYLLTQTTNSYYTDNSVFYVGQSLQNLMDIKFLELNPITGEGGGWFEVIPKTRIPSNSSAQFIIDYYKSISVFDPHNIFAWVIQTLTGAISIKQNDGDAKIQDLAWLTKMLQRVLGLCFDNRTEIDVSGVSKISETDGIDQSFFELTEIDLREIEQKVIDIKNGVIEFEDCENVKFPVNVDALLDSLDKLTYVKDKDFDDVAENLPNILINQDNFPGGKNLPNFSIFDKDFIKSLFNGLIAALLSPKVLLPIAVMLKASGQYFEDKINSFETFFKNFKQFAINLFSKIGSLFVKELFTIIKKDIKNLILSVIKDINIESKNKKVKMILKLVQLLVIGLSLIQDWRKCKSIVDELLSLLALAGVNLNNIPLPILFASRLLEGYSHSRAFIGTIEELQKLGIPTGPLPDGSPNLNVLAMYSQLIASANEEDENGKTQIAIGPLTITPSGFTVPASGYGKKL